MLNCAASNDLISNNLQAYAEETIKTHQIPAVSIAIWKNGKLSTAAAGILNLSTGVEATTDSIFQIGSITKIFTTCLVMKLVEQGKIDLDTPVKYYLRSFSIADPQASETITVRQLLNHTSGMAGDYFPKDERENGPHIARYLDRCAQLPLIHQVGEGFSYCNAGFTIAGRLIEVMTGMSWYDAMETLIFQPLDMNHAICRPADVIRYRTALGHIPDTNNPDKMRPCSGSYLSLSHAPAGCTVTMTAADLITFARTHLDCGKDRSGNSWLSEKSIHQMQAPTVEIPMPIGPLVSHLGLGWFVSDHRASGKRFVRHSGSTNGQCSNLRLFPEQKSAFALLLNSEKTGVLEHVTEELTEAVGGINSLSDNSRMLTVAREVTVDTLGHYVGRYHSFMGVYTFALSSAGLTGTFDWSIGEEPPIQMTLLAQGEHCFSMIDPQGIPMGQSRFLNFNSKGIPLQVFIGIRLYQRISQ